MRAAAFFTLAAGVLIAASVSAVADTVAFDFTIGLSGSGSGAALLSPSALTFNSSAFSLFDPKLGTLNSVSETVTGSLTWTTGRKFELSGGQSGAFGATLKVSDDTAAQTFRSFTSSPQVIDIDVSGTETDAADLLAFIGKGTMTTYFSLLGSGTTGQTVSAATLEGTLTYDYTPAPAGAPTSAVIPEPSTWAMMVIGFTGLGYAAVRRKRRRAHLA